MRTTKSILLVDDDRDDQENFIQALRQIKQATLFDVVNNAREVIEMLEHSQELPDTIFMDINMPYMSGIEYLSAVKKYPRLSKVPVIMLTSAIEQREQALKLGARAFIKKTSDDKKFLHEIEYALNMVTRPSMNFTLRGPIKSAILTNRPQCYVVYP